MDWCIVASVKLTVKLKAGLMNSPDLATLTLVLLTKLQTSHHYHNVGIPTEIKLTTTIGVGIGLEGAAVGNDG